LNSFVVSSERLDLTGNGKCPPSRLAQVYDDRLARASFGGRFIRRRNLKYRSDAAHRRLVPADRKEK
jgi:hypothetical protein